MASILAANGVLLGQGSTSQRAAIDRCGSLLRDIGAVDEPYIRAMHEREAIISTYIGKGVAVPHGTIESRSHIRRTAIAVVQYPDGIDWNGFRVSVCIPIAADGDLHLRLLSAISTVLLDPVKYCKLCTATEPVHILAQLTALEQEQVG